MLGRLGAASVCWASRRPAAPLDPPQHRPSAENIAAHYDLGNEFYAYFLDDDLLYSSALFTDDQQDLTRPSGPRWRALCDQLALTPGDHLLEIGTGWGRWPSTPPAITAAGSPPPPFPGAAPLGYRAHGPPGCRIASKCCCDYRDLRGEYDKLVSVEMIEAVGQRYLRPSSAPVRRACARAAEWPLQAITIGISAIATTAKASILSSATSSPAFCPASRQ